MDFSQHSLWVEKYRPKLLKDCVLPKKIHNIFKGFIQNKNIPNLLFYGSAGNSKTTSAKMLVNELGADSLYIDCSSESGRDAVLDMIVPFASTISINDSQVPKIIILDEADGLSGITLRSSTSPQQMLRAIMEQYSANARFIFTCNYEAKIIPALKSRCSCINFATTKEDKPQIMLSFMKRCEMILTENNVSFDRKILSAFIAKTYPDLRRIINELQSYSNANGSIDEGILSVTSSTIATELYPLIVNKKFEECRKWISESLSSPEDIFGALYMEMRDFIPAKKQPESIIILADYQYKSAFVMDQKMNLLACCIEIMGIL